MRQDPHSYADLDQGRTRHVDLELTVDFANRVLHGSATLHFDAPVSGPLDLDSRGLAIESVSDDGGNPVPFERGETDPVLGERLRLELGDAVHSVTLRYRTSPTATGLMWLEPAQTDGGTHPFLLSQCQAIHARSLVPVQDTPRARITYHARLDVPGFAGAVMSAAPGAAETATDGRQAFTFDMPQPIPPYLLALAVGDLASHDLGPRCRVYAEPGVIDAAAWEFADVERMLSTAEELFGPYPWDRYDFIVLPQSFPLGGMENPRMTFLTPTLIAGDRSLVGVLAHELAHSWTGNLVTNATNEDFWLNEGWTVWAERRILEHIYGEEEATQQACLGRHALEATLAERESVGAHTALSYDQQGLDPDAEFSKLPYEKGFLLITALERAVGRERFDVFVGQYIEHFGFQSIDSAMFEAFVHEELPDADVDLDAWIRDPGLPAGAPDFHSKRLDAIESLAESGGVPGGTDDWSITEKLVYLAHLPSSADAAAVSRAFGVGGTANAELRSAWLAFAIRSGAKGLEPAISALIDTVGRTKLLRPVVREAAERADLRAHVIARVDANRTRLHSSTRLALDAVIGRGQSATG